MLRFLIVSSSLALAAPHRKGPPTRPGMLKSATLALGTMITGAGAGVPLAVAAEQATLGNMLVSSRALHEGFAKFGRDYNRDYMGPDGSCSVEEAAEECGKRLQTFEANVQQAYKLNEEGGAVFGVTKFMDMDDEEFARHFKGLKLTDEDRERLDSAPRVKVAADFLAPSKRDWRDEGIITPVKDQKHCGSCWAHSVVEQVESMAIKNNVVGKDFRGSPQELVACDTFDSGCNGGSPLFGFDYLGKHALETESDYPYTSGTGKSGTCKADFGKGKVETGEIYLFDDENDMKNFMQKTGPISIAVDALHWKTYKSGIFPANQCTGKVDHAVQAVGIDLGASEPYWIVRNSWNTDWGEDGFIRLPFGKQACSLTEMPSTADVKAPEAEQGTGPAGPGAQEVEEVEEQGAEAVDAVREIDV